MTVGKVPVFDASARARFARGYPEQPHTLEHGLHAHPLLTLDAIADLAEQLPASSVEYNRGDLPIGVDGKPATNGLSIGATIRSIAANDSWAVLKNIEQVPAYRALVHDCLAELREEVRAATGAMLHMQGFLFISSPDAVTPYHFDPEHNLLLQLTGHKTMMQFPAGDPAFAPDEVHETYQTGGPRELRWDDAMLAGGTAHALAPGQAVYVPVMAPHYVRNGPASSTSLSITWRSDWSYAEADARGFNKLLRKAGFTPAAPRRWPHGNRAKALAYRSLRKARLVR